MDFTSFSREDQDRLDAFWLYQDGLAALSMGDFAAGWNLHEERLRVFPPSYQKCLSPTPDNPAAFAGRDVVIIGDPDYTPFLGGALRPEWRVIMGGYEVMFAQYYPALLAQNPKSLRVLADPRLCSLLQRSFPSIEVLPRPQDVEHIPGFIQSLWPQPDMIVPLASLGKAFIKSRADVPFASAPWIKPDSAAIQASRSFLCDAAGGRIPVALSPWGTGIYGKSINASDFFAPFETLADHCLFINFQYAAPKDRASASIRQAFTEAFGVKGMASVPFDLWDDQESTAAMLAAIRDEGGAAVMIPNYTEQIACSIGVQTFKPLHGLHAADYGFGRAWNEDLFIYPWTNTYLQEESGIWEPVLEDIARDLAHHVGGRQPVRRRHDVSGFKPK